MKIVRLAAAAAVVTVLLAVPAAADVIDPVISSNEPGPFPQDAENEPTLAIDRNPSRKDTFLVAGANDYRDQSVCKEGGCAFTRGVGISGVYWSADGATWVDGRYTGYASPTGNIVAPRQTIRTLPHFTKDRWTHGDPVLAVGPMVSATTTPSWSAGTLFYYSTLAAGTKQSRSVSVSTAFASPSAPAAQPVWRRPVNVSGSDRRWLDKPSIWVDNARSSRSFGTAYVCWSTFGSRGASESGAPPNAPIRFARSTTGGRVWERTSLPKGIGSGRHGCAIRTDSAGRVYVFWTEFRITAAGAKWLKSPSSGVECRTLFDAWLVMAESADGRQFVRPLSIRKVSIPGRTDRVQRRCTIDGVAGARTNGFPAVDIANGAPSGYPQPHRDTIAVAWSDGTTGDIMLLARVNGSWRGPWKGTSRSDVAAAFPGIALTPNGRNVYVVYNGFAQPWQNALTTPRTVAGVVRAAVVAQLVRVGASARWGEIRSLPGDARGSSDRDLTAEFLGDYSAVVAIDSRAYAAWTDAAATLECGPVTGYRRELTLGKHPRFKLGDQCPPKLINPREGFRFGNVTICGVAFTADVAGSGQVKRVTDCKPGARGR